MGQSLNHRQVLVTLCASVAMFQCGLLKGFNSTAIPSMKLISPHLVPDYSTISWITSVGLLASVPTLLYVGPVMQALGRRRLMLVAGPLLSLSWLALSLAPTPALIISAKAVTGVFTCCLLVSSQLYVAESVSAEVRGALSCLLTVAQSLGVLSSYIAGAWLPWHLLARLTALPALLLAAVLIPLPESPAWLLLRNRSVAAHEASRWLALPCNTQKAALLQPPPPSELFSRPVMVPFALTVMLFIFQQTCGNDVVIYNTVLIFSASETEVDKFLATIIVGTVLVLFTVISSFWVDRYGRKFNLLISAFIMCASMSGLALFFTLQPLNLSHISFLPLTSMIIYIAGYSVGFAGVPYTFSSEILPLKQRSVLKSTSAAVGMLFMFLEVKTYFSLVEWLGQAGPFWIYCGFNLFSFLAIAWLVPETKGKSLEEIELHFRSKYASSR